MLTSPLSDCKGISLRRAGGDEVDLNGRFLFLRDKDNKQHVTRVQIDLLSAEVAV